MDLPPKRSLELDILPQPDDSTCGPTCLHAVYRYWGEDLQLAQVIREVGTLEEGGTLAVLLGCHALRRGYDASIYTYNLQVYDPSWFTTPGVELRQKLMAMAAAFPQDTKLQVAVDGYLEFLALGGRVRWRDLTPGLIRHYLVREIPILAGLSATYLYNCSRERVNEHDQMEYDDVRGRPTGHFVVLSGFDTRRNHVLISDPLRDNPAYRGQRYAVDTQRAIASILLGMVTYDANLLVVQPR